MKLSEHSVNVLRNFSGIKAGILLRKGTKQTIVADDGSIVAEANLEDIMPQDFGIYDLHQFLGNINTMENPELSFNDKLLTLTSSDGIETEYYGCDVTLFKNLTDGKDWEVKDPDARFDLGEKVLSKLLKMAATNVLPNFSISGKNGEIMVQVHQKANPTSNKSRMKVGSYTGPDFTTTFRVANLKMLPGNYTVEVKNGRFAKFTSTDHKLWYIIATETK